MDPPSNKLSLQATWEALRPRLKEHRIAIGIVLVALVLHLVNLEAWPSPAGDEVNWFQIGADMHAGRQPKLPPAGMFVPMVFGRVVALGFIGGTIDWWHARIGPALVVLALACATYAVCFGAGRKRAALWLLGWQLLTPWSIAWSRTVSVPYALAAGLGALGTVIWWWTLDAEAGQKRTLAQAVALQFLLLGFCFTPFAAIFCVAAGIAMLAHPRRRSLVLSPGPWVGVALALVEVLPIVRGATAVAGSHHPDLAQITADLGTRLPQYGAALVDGVSGAATLQHFVWGRCNEPAFAGVLWWVLRGLALVFGIGTLAFCARDRDSWSKRALLTFGIACVGTVVLLAPARAWWFPTIDSDRYAFAWSVPFGLCAAMLVEGAPRRGSRSASRRIRILPWVLAACFAAPTVALFAGFANGGGPDCGVPRADGGAWRGWRASSGPRALPEWLAENSITAANGEAMPLMIDDPFGLRAVEVSLGIRTKQIEVKWAEHDPEGRPLVPKGAFLVALWPTFLFGVPSESSLANQKLLDAVVARGGRIVARAYAANGRLLLELWRVEAR